MTASAARRAADPAESYLAQIASRLPGPARAHAAIITELRAGLADAADAHRAAGLSPDEAAAAAVREFGDPRQVAAGFGPELAARQARRAALALLGTGPLIGMLWARAAAASHLGVRAAPPWQWSGLPPAVRAGIPMTAAVIVAVIGAAAITVAVTGRLSRWLPCRPRMAPAAAALAGTGAAAADVLILAMLASQLSVAPGRLSAAPATAAAAASLARLVLARRAASRCLATRAALAAVSPLPKGSPGGSRPGRRPGRRPTGCPAAGCRTGPGR